MSSWKRTVTLKDIKQEIFKVYEEGKANYCCIYRIFYKQNICGDDNIKSYVYVGFYKNQEKMLNSKNNGIEYLKITTYDNSIVRNIVNYPKNGWSSYEYQKGYKYFEVDWKNVVQISVKDVPDYVKQNGNSIILTDKIRHTEGEPIFSLIRSDLFSFYYNNKNDAIKLQNWGENLWQLYPVLKNIVDSWIDDMIIESDINKLFTEYCCVVPKMEVHSYDWDIMLYKKNEYYILGDSNNEHEKYISDDYYADARELNGNMIGWSPKYDINRFVMTTDEIGAWLKYKLMGKSTDKMERRMKLYISSHEIWKYIKDLFAKTNIINDMTDWHFIEANHYTIAEIKRLLQKGISNKIKIQENIVNDILKNYGKLKFLKKDFWGMTIKECTINKNFEIKEIKVEYLFNE